jgi:hypothetical protein
VPLSHVEIYVLLVRWSTVASVECASDCESEEVCCVQVILALFDLRLLLVYCFCNIPRYANTDYTIQAVCLLTFILDRQGNEDNKWSRRTAAAHRNAVSCDYYC